MKKSWQTARLKPTFFFFSCKHLWLWMNTVFKQSEKPITWPLVYRPILNPWLVVFGKACSECLYMRGVMWGTDELLWHFNRLCLKKEIKICGSGVWVSGFRNCVTTSKDFLCKQLFHFTHFNSHSGYGKVSTPGYEHLDILSTWWWFEQTSTVDICVRWPCSATA